MTPPPRAKGDNPGIIDRLKKIIFGVFVYGYIVMTADTVFSSAH